MIKASFTGIDSTQRTLTRIQRKLTRERVTVMTAAARATLVPAIRAAAPTDTGKLARSVGVRRGKKAGTLAVGPRAWYRHLVIGGTRAHQITPKNRRSVGPRGRWQRANANHPGTRSNPFVARGLAGQRRAYVDAIAKEMFER